MTTGRTGDGSSDPVRDPVRDPRRDALVARLRATFLAELEDQLGAGEQGVQRLRQDPRDPEEIRALFRVVHTLKGAAGAAGVPSVERICHDAEALLASARSGDRALEGEELDGLARALGRLRAEQAALVGGDASHDAARTPRAVHEARDAGASAGASAGGSVPRDGSASGRESSPSPDGVAGAGAGAGAEQTIRVPVDRLDALLTASNRLVMAAGISEGASASLASAIDEMGRLHALAVRARRALAGESRGSESRGSESRGSESRGSESRGSESRGSESRGSESRGSAALAALEEGLRQAVGAGTRLADTTTDGAAALAALATELSGRVRELRLRPFADAVDGLERMVGEIAGASGKEVRFTVEGMDIEADRSVLVQVREALLHLVRNAVDHGIEPAEQRIAAGKSPVGEIVVHAGVEADRVLVQVRDDGRGIDVSAVRRELERRGRAADADDRTLVNALFDGGISTRATASTVSGRGVGLDAARASLARVRGTVRVEWTEGRGTTFIIDTPLTLATIRAVLARAGDLTVAVPTAAVRRLTRARRADLAIVEGRAALPTPEGPVLLASITSVMGVGGDSGDGEHVHAVVLDDPAGRRIAIRVDALLDEDEIVVRPIRGQGSRPARHASGAALLPSGDVALVLDVAAVLADAAAQGGDVRAAPRAAETRTRRRVLVVDDSITTRTLEQSVLASAGYDVITATDGADGWRQLQEHGADLVVADVEMPRMDGLALCRAIRQSRRFQATPVILITGLESAADRMRGLEAGADAYLGKSSFEQTALLDVVQDLLGGR